MSLSVVIVNWNSGEHLRHCLNSIVEANAPPGGLDRVIIVDNASTDGSVYDIGSNALPVTLVRNTRNRGFAAACNQGARLCDSDLLLFLNPDTVLTTSSLENPVRFLQCPANEDIGVLGIQLVDEQGKVLRTCVSFPNAAHFICQALGLHRLWPSRFGGYGMQSWDHSTSRYVPHVMGAYFLVRRKVFEVLGGFDERFFVYLEDLDFCLRARAMGWSVFYYSGAKAFHKCGGSSEHAQSEALFYSLHSRLSYAHKHFGARVALAPAIATLMVEPVGRLVLAMRSRSREQMAYTIQAYRRLWGLLLTKLAARLDFLAGREPSP